MWNILWLFYFINNFIIILHYFSRLKMHHFTDWAVIHFILCMTLNSGSQALQLCKFVFFNFFQVSEHFWAFGGTQILKLGLIVGFYGNPVKNEWNNYVPWNPGWRTLMYGKNERILNESSYLRQCAAEPWWCPSQILLRRCSSARTRGTRNDINGHPLMTLQFSTFYEQLLSAQFPKAQKDTDDSAVFCAFVISIKASSKVSF